MLFLMSEAFKQVRYTLTVQVYTVSFNPENITYLDYT